MSCLTGNAGAHTDIIHTYDNFVVHVWDEEWNFAHSNPTCSSALNGDN